MLWTKVLENEYGTPLYDAIQGDRNEQLIDDEDSPEDGRINMFAGHWVDVELRVIDHNVESWFLYGNCVILAWEMHLLTGWDVVLIENVVKAEGNSPWCHALVRHPDGSLVDINGKQSEVSIVNHWTDFMKAPYEAVDYTAGNHEAFFKHVTDEEHAYDMEASLADKYFVLEREVTKDFARVLLKSL